MPSAQFESLRLELLRGGVAPVYVERTLLELEEHYADLQSDALAAGFAAEEAARSALTALGSERAIAAAVLSRPELLEWSTRWPRVALCVRSAATIGVLPGLPLVFCIQHRPELARWGGALGIALAFVGAILAWLNWMIAVG
jgi:hypothetical protein